MSYSIKPANPVETREFTCEQIQIIQFLLCPHDTIVYDWDNIPEFLEKDYRFFIPFAYRDGTEQGHFVGNCGFIYSNGDSADCLCEDVPMEIDIYCCPNGFKKPHRNEDNLVCIQNLVIDLDCHGDSLSMPDLHKLIMALKPKIIQSLPIKPNFVHCTGRGLHLWYCIEPCNLLLKPQCLSAVSMLCDMVKQRLADLPEANLEVDRGASMRLSGLFRLPFTYNTKAKRWSTGVLLHKRRPNIIKLIKSLYRYGFRCYDFSPESVKEKIASDSHQRQQRYISANKIKASHLLKKGDYTPCFLYRKKALEAIIETTGVSEGNRERFLFAYYCVMCNLYGDDEAQEALLTLNDSLESPLPFSEVRHIIHSYDKKQYRFTDEKFFRFIGQPKPDLPHEPTQKELRKRAVQLRKKKRDEDVLSHYAAGKPIAAIARDLGYSRTTVYKIIKTASQNS